MLDLIIDQFAVKVMAIAWEKERFLSFAGLFKAK